MTSTLTAKQQACLDWVRRAGRPVTVAEAVAAGFGPATLGLLDNKGLVRNLGFRAAHGRPDKSGAQTYTVKEA